MLKKETLENDQYRTLFIKQEINEEEKKEKEKEREIKKIRPVNM